MEYKAIIAKIHNVREHPNADNIKLATCCGNQIVVAKDTEENSIGVYFEVNTKLSDDFCKNNNLYRDCEKNKNVEEGGFFENNRRVRAQKFRGEISDGFWCPLSYLDFTGHNHLFEVGEEFTELEGIQICKKYVAPVNKSGKEGKVKKKHPMFKEHFDTDHFGKNINRIPFDAICIITEKVHGTSQRVGHVLTKVGGLTGRFLKFFGIDTWKNEYLIGTRRVVLAEAKQLYHSNLFREMAAEPFLGQLKEGETVYYEVVGYEDYEKPIMGRYSHKKLDEYLSRKEVVDFKARYGSETIFDYNCNDGSFRIFVYRITLTNREGFSIDYSWEALKQRCTQLGVNFVPELFVGTRRELEAKGGFEKTVKDSANYKQSTCGEHIPEGVCVRVESGITPSIYKEKKFEYKVIEGIASEADKIDLEEIS